MGFVLLLGLQCAAGVIATVSDLRTGKIYDKHLVLIGLFGSGVYAAFRHELVDGYGKDVILNAVTSLVMLYARLKTRRTVYVAIDAGQFMFLSDVDFQTLVRDPRSLPAELIGELQSRFFLSTEHKELFASDAGKQEARGHSLGQGRLPR